MSIHDNTSSLLHLYFTKFTSLKRDQERTIRTVYLLQAKYVHERRERKELYANSIYGIYIVNGKSHCSIHSRFLSFLGGLSSAIGYLLQLSFVA